MQGDRPQHGYDLLTHLRRLETRIARLQKGWQAFRGDPRPERLEEFREAFARTDLALGELADRLGAGEPASVADDPSRADARSVVDAGRTLDQALAEISRAWGFLRREPDPEGLDGLADRLARAEAAAALLRRALPPTDSPAGPEEAPDSRRRTATAGAGSLDTLLSRIRDDWQNLRRDPASDRAGVLRGELAEARRLAESLRHRLETDTPDESTARYLTGMDDSVRFAPYRDAFTGLYNREGFDTLAGAELKRCRRYSRSFGLLLIETRAADLAELRGAIATLKSLLRGYDLVSRYSDRQLVVGLPETDGAETRRIAARLLRALEADGRSPVSRLSYALMPEDGASLASLMQTAEDDLAGELGG